MAALAAIFFTVVVTADKIKAVFFNGTKYVICITKNRANSKSLATQRIVFNGKIFLIM